MTKINLQWKNLKTAIADIFPADYVPLLYPIFRSELQKRRSADVKSVCKQKRKKCFIPVDINELRNVSEDVARRANKHNPNAAFYCELLNPNKTLKIKL